MPPPARLGDADRWSEEAWERFAGEYRRQRAPDELRQRVIAAIRAAAAAGSWQELLDGGGTGRPASATRRAR